MNSQSNNNCNNNNNNQCDCPPRFAVCKPVEDLHPLPCPALLECGTAANPKIDENTEFPVFVASVDIDTTCLCFPTVKIEFSTLIDYLLNGNETITIRLSRVCNNGCNNGNPVTLKTFTLAPVTAGGGTKTLPFSFIHCIQNAPSKECTYIVEVTATTNLEPNEFFEFKNTEIAALAVGCIRECK